MTDEPTRADAQWLAWREPADAEARSTDLVERVRAMLPGDEPLLVHDLGSGTGSMARWLAPQLPGQQHWVMHDRDADLLPLATAPVTFETRQDDVTDLDPDELAGASLITASALLDMMTAEELDRFVTTSARPGCAVLIALTVTGQVDLSPAAPLDLLIATAFNEHQRRGGRLGPDAANAAVAAFTRLGRNVAARPSPWHLGPDHPDLTRAWFDGWLGAALEQEPSLANVTASYAARRRDQLASGELRVVVDHKDLLVPPLPTPRR